MKLSTIAIILGAALGSLSCSTLGMRTSYVGSSPPLTAAQVKMVVNVASAMKLPTKLLGGSHPIVNTEIGHLVPDLPARTQGAGIGDFMPNNQKILSLWIYHYWLNDNAILLVTAEQKASGFVITDVMVKRGGNR